MVSITRALIPIFLVGLTLSAQESSAPDPLKASLKVGRNTSIQGMLATLSKHRVIGEGKLRQIFSECGANSRKYAEAYRRYIEAAGAVSGIATFLKADDSGDISELKGYALETEASITRFYEIEYIDCKSNKKQGMFGDIVPAAIQGLMNFGTGQIAEWFNKRHEDRARRDQILNAIEWREPERLSLLPPGAASAGTFQMGPGAPGGGGAQPSQPPPAAGLAEMPELIEAFGFQGLGNPMNGQFMAHMGTPIKVELRFPMGASAELSWGPSGTQPTVQSVGSGVVECRPEAEGLHVFQVRAWTQQGTMTRRMEVVVTRK
jgi:hypothetical protein